MVVELVPIHVCTAVNMQNHVFVAQDDALEPMEVDRPGDAGMIHIKNVKICDGTGREPFPGSCCSKGSASRLSAKGRWGIWTPRPSTGRASLPPLGL